PHHAILRVCRRPSPKFRYSHSGTAGSMNECKRRNSRMATGTVKWFNATKGYGFIAHDNGGGDVCAHISAGERAGLTTWVDGQRMSFEVERGRRTGKSSGGSRSMAA